MKREDEQLELWVALAQVHETVGGRLSERLEATIGIPLIWYDVLARVAVAPGGAIRMQDLASSMLLSRSGLTRLFDRLEEAGLVERQDHPTDRRGTLAVLTKAGRAKFEQGVPHLFGGIGEFLGQHLNVEERRVLRSALQKVIGANGGAMCWNPTGMKMREMTPAR